MELVWIFLFLTGWVQNIFGKIVQNKSSNLIVKKTLENLSYPTTYFFLIKRRKIISNENSETVVTYLIKNVLVDKFANGHLCSSSYSM